MKYLFFVINVLCIVGMAYIGVNMAYDKLTPPKEPAEASAVNPPDQRRKPDARPRPPVRKRMDPAIISRNLFKVKIDGSDKPAPVTTQTSKPVEETHLNLSLWGTVVGPTQEESWAVIEDKSTRQQALYKVGSNVQDAKITKIDKSSVDLLFQGRPQVLKMEDLKGSSSPGKRPAASSTAARRPNLPLPQALARTAGPISRQASDLLRQIKFRPRNIGGELDGYIVYGIRPSSIFKKMGLRNGDVIREINGTPVAEQDNPSELFEEIMQSDEIRLTLLRAGKPFELVYPAEGQANDES